MLSEYHPWTFFCPLRYKLDSNTKHNCILCTVWLLKSQVIKSTAPLVRTCHNRSSLIGETWSVSYHSGLLEKGKRMTPTSNNYIQSKHSFFLWICPSCKSSPIKTFVGICKCIMSSIFFLLHGPVICVCVCLFVNDSVCVLVCEWCSVWLWLHVWNKQLTQLTKFYKK